ncbi:putative succinate fumarate mitochondrial transporter protein [Phaeoacremonium minimum UCRPA7]|uniref:Putative succinate fumarate mitochondrial transporter protein n=1 Tax=Phaeoacremonium minimum (strain UCR-PA7) TaxID=1286976 RepID=R8BK85_PHAM7|nr:putative succinate fumarate mitochondrial transporter protein [Phaeoacremonium minimum UCRPA7]EON99726.1 putative succinate fumarate mitochondrial transporter protein [Phaeoacremonium minimum UCRPA7]
MATKVNGKDGKKPASAATNLIAGGGAGMMEALVCHPLDTIKVRMQLSRRGRQPGMPKRGFIRTGVEIVKKETPLGLYKGLGAVLTGIVPKMAIRFTSFESYKQLLADKNTGMISSSGTFVAGLAAGVTEAVAVVTPMEVIKIRLQAQHHSMADPLDIPKYRNAAHALYTVVKEEGFGALYRGVSLTALRQGSNQAVNFTAYTYFKEVLKQWQPEYATGNLPSWQTTVIGLVSGAMGPLSNAPIDTIKTRLQKTPAQEGVSAIQRITAIASDMFRQEGMHAFYKGITPRIMRVAPGQAVTFTVYEFLKDKIEKSQWSLSGGEYEE